MKRFLPNSNGKSQELIIDKNSLYPRFLIALEMMKKARNYVHFRYALCSRLFSPLGGRAKRVKAAEVRKARAAMRKAIR
jgi:hypothetical protein